MTVNDFFLSAQMIIITNPLIGDEGGSLEIVCQAIAPNGNTVSPESIAIQRNSVVFVDSRLSSTTNGTHRIYTFAPLDRVDNGSRVQCVISPLISVEVPIQVNCKYINAPYTQEHRIQTQDSNQYHSP